MHLHETTSLTLWDNNAGQSKQIKADTKEEEETQMKNSELQKMLEAHKLWIDSNKKQGEQANFCGADLRGAHLCETNLDFFDRNFA